MLDVLEGCEGRGESGQEEPLVDIIAVHGLNPTNKELEAHARGTWTKNGHLWLKDLGKTFPRARVMLQGYDASPLSMERRESVLQQSSQMLEEIRVKRTQRDIKDPKRPIIFIMHSLGGLMVKQALVVAKNNENYTPILEATRCLMFFATPHGGGNTTMVSWGSAASGVARALMLKKQSDLFNALKDESVQNEHLKEYFRHMYEKLYFVSFYERVGTVVKQSDAVLGLGGLRENIVGLDGSHSEICRFDPKLPKDRRMQEMVQANLYDLYDKAIQGEENVLLHQLPRNAQDHHYAFGLALRDVSMNDEEMLELEMGMIVEDIVWTAHGMCRGRVRSKQRNFSKNDVVLITSQAHEQTLACSSSKRLFDEAKEFSDEIVTRNTEAHAATRFVDRLFMTTVEGYGKLNHSGRDFGVYVDRAGQIQNEAIHMAVLNQDCHLVEFLLRRNPRGCRLRCWFPGYTREAPDGQSRLPWGWFEGIPLTVATNSYAAIKHKFPSRSVQTQEAQKWATIFNLLFSEDRGWETTQWADFVESSPLLGPGSHLRIDGQALLERSIEYNDHTMFKRMINAAQHSEITMDYLPSQYFLDFTNCAGFRIERYKRLNQTEVPWVVKVLHRLIEDPDYSGDHLYLTVPKILWASLGEAVDLHADLMKEMVELVMANISKGFSAASWTVSSNIKRLLECQIRPEFHSWAKSRKYRSVLHYAAEMNSLEALKTLMESKHDTRYLFLKDLRGRTLLDIAIEKDNEEMLLYLNSEGFDAEAVDEVESVPFTSPAISVAQWLPESSLTPNSTSDRYFPRPDRSDSLLTTPNLYPLDHPITPLSEPQRAGIRLAQPLLPSPSRSLPEDGSLLGAGPSRGFLDRVSQHIPWRLGRGTSNTPVFQSAAPILSEQQNGILPPISASLQYANSPIRTSVPNIQIDKQHLSSSKQYQTRNHSTQAASELEATEFTLPESRYRAQVERSSPDQASDLPGIGEAAQETDEERPGKPGEDLIAAAHIGPQTSPTLTPGPDKFTTKPQESKRTWSQIAVTNHKPDDRDQLSRLISPTTEHGSSSSKGLPTQSSTGPRQETVIGRTFMQPSESKRTSPRASSRQSQIEQEERGNPPPLSSPSPQMPYRVTRSHQRHISSETGGNPGGDFPDPVRKDAGGQSGSRRRSPKKRGYQGVSAQSKGMNSRPGSFTGNQ